jgi:hypothetical protein
MATCPSSFCFAIAGTWNLSLLDSRTRHALYALFRLERQFFGGWAGRSGRLTSYHCNECLLIAWVRFAADITGCDTTAQFQAIA